MIKHALQEDYDYILEGHHIHPVIVTEIKKKAGRGKIRSAFITRYDIDRIVAGCMNNSSPRDWFRDETENYETMPKIAGMIREYSAHFEKQAKRYRHKVFNIDYSFHQGISKVVKYLKN